MKVVTTSVLIVGGAGAGLASSIFLARRGIDSHVIERHASTSPLPKAHYLNQRTMELFREIGLSDTIYERSTPAENMSTVGWYTSLAGDGPLDGKTLYTMDAFGGGSLKAAYERHSPCRSANYAQMHVEPLLYEHAGKNPLSDLAFGCELIDFTQADEGVTARVLNKSTGEEYTVQASYMLACDGGRFVGPTLGIAMEGIQRLFDMVTVHFAADLSAFIDDDKPMIRWFTNPESGGSWGSGVFVALGPKQYDRHSGEWLMHFSFDPDKGSYVDTPTLVSKIKELLRIPSDTGIEVIKTNTWKVQAVLAETFRSGRVFLVGDAAHRHPPTTGLGLNSAIQDAHNIAWKLALVLKGKAGASLLDTYEAERRRVTERNVNWAMLTFQNHFVIDAGIGVIYGAPVEVNREAFVKLFANNDEGAARRQRLHEVIMTQRMEFQAEDVEIGFHYESSAIVGDGTPPPVKSPMGDEHIPTSRPGHRLPHAWIARDNEPISTLDLIDGSAFVLISGGDDRWQAIVDQAQGASDVELKHCRIANDSDYRDRDGGWSAVSGISGNGAILVRPDGHVCWRSQSTNEGSAQALTAALKQVLAVQ